MSESKQERPVLQAITKVMASVGAVEKKGKNSFHNYEFATAADIMHALQKRMAEAGLVITASQRKIEFMGNEAVMLVEFAFSIEHTSGDKYDEPVLFSGMAGCKNKNGSFDDKAVNKCLVGAMKYFLLNLFKIPTGDYHDADADGDGPAPQSPPQSPPEQRQPPKSPAKASTATNGTKAADEAPTGDKHATYKQGALGGAPFGKEDQLNDGIPFGDDGGQVSYIDTKGGKHPMDLDKFVNRLEQIAQARDTFSDEDFAAAMWRNAECQERAAAAWRALWASRNMKADDWRPK